MGGEEGEGEDETWARGKAEGRTARRRRRWRRGVVKEGGEGVVKEGGEGAVKEGGESKAQEFVFQKEEGKTERSKDSKKEEGI